MERATRKLTCPKSQVTIEVKDYLTGREMESLALFEAQGVDDKHKNLEASHMAIEMVVLSVSGSKENIVEQCLDLPAQDYRFITEYISKLLQGEEEVPEAKKENV